MNDAKWKLILNEIREGLDKVIAHDLASAVLYGSYARGDYDAESDIDIAVLVKCSRMEMKKYTDALADLMIDLNLNYDILVSFCCIPIDEFMSKKGVLPFYRNIATEGVAISA